MTAIFASSDSDDVVLGVPSSRWIGRINRCMYNRLARIVMRQFRGQDPAEASVRPEVDMGYNERRGAARHYAFMNIQALFGLSVLMSFVAFGLVTQLYILPRLRILERNDALIPLVVPHTFRFIGLSFLVPGVVSPSLPSALATPGAYGDLVAAILAVAATIALSRRASFAIALVWLFNVWGATDLLFAYYQGLFGVQLNPGDLGAAFFIPTAVVPPLLITHGVIFWLLVRPKQ